MEKGVISVDRWCEESQAYFLTHLHADHTAGLSPKWSKGPLYCSPISANLFPAKFPGFDLSLLRVLEIGSSHSLSLTSPLSGLEIRVLVTPIDAHHCPGAVMYLFCGEFGCMLYTGDFRWETNTDRGQVANCMLLNALRGEEVDFLYLDNTYCNPSFSFPPREVAAQQVVDIIDSHPDHDIVIGVDTLGKEDLLLHISRALRTKIWVWPERLQIMHLLGFGDVFTTKTCLTRVRAVPRYSLTIDNVDALNTVRPTIGIMPSGLPWGVRLIDEKDASLGKSLSICHRSKGSTNGRIHENQNELKQKLLSPKMLHHSIYSVPYSDHSCFSELHDFVKLICPSKISGIVSSSFCYINPRHYFRDLCGNSQLSGWPLKKPRRSNPSESGKIIPTSVFGCSKFNETKGQGDRAIACLRKSRSRGCILRQQRHGAKIAESEVALKSDLNIKNYIA